MLLRELDCPLPVAGLRHDVVPLLGEHLGEVEPDQGLVLGDHHPAWGGLLSVHRGRVSGGRPRDRGEVGPFRPSGAPVRRDVRGRARPQRARRDDARARCRRRGRCLSHVPDRTAPAAAVSSRHLSSVGRSNETVLNLVDKCNGFAARRSRPTEVSARRLASWAVGPGIPIGRECGLKHRPVWVRVPPGARHIVGAQRDAANVYSTEDRLHALRLLNESRSLNAVSKQTGISRSALREWPDHGGRSMTPGSACWQCRGVECEPQPAYAALLGFYLGDGCISRLPRTHNLRVSCDRIYPASMTGSTGHACFLSTDRDRDTCVTCIWRTGNGRSFAHSRVRFSVASSTATAVVSTTGRNGGWPVR